MKGQTITIIILAFLLVSVGGVFAYKEVVTKINNSNIQAYSIGYKDGQTQFYNQLIQSLSSNGQIIIPIKDENNKTINVRLVVG